MNIVCYDCWNMKDDNYIRYESCKAISESGAVFNYIYEAAICSECGGENFNEEVWARNGKDRRVVKLIEGDNTPSSNYRNGYFSRKRDFRQVNFTRYHGFREFGKKHRRMQKMLLRRGIELSEHIVDKEGMLSEEEMLSLEEIVNE